MKPEWKQPIWITLIAFALLLSGCGLVAERATPTPESTEMEPIATSEPPATPTPTETPQPTLVNPSLAISPTSGPPGTQVEVVGQGFPPETRVEIGVGRVNSEYDLFDESVTDGEGSLTTTLLIPTYIEPQDRVVAVATALDGDVEVMSNVFQVTQQQYQGAVTIRPASGPPGTVVRVMARDFPPNADVDIGIGRVNSEYDVIAAASADENGRVDAEITIPDFVEPEDRWVIVVAAAHRPVKAISEEFDVTRAAAPTETPGGLFTRTNIYLIALGDEGGSGKEIGCGDSVVPVEVEIEPTIAPLTAALNKLLIIDTREYGQSGLYNALYRSDLTVESVNLTGGEAVIRLSGTLTLGGVCDEPRVEAQLRETALQFSTVQEVSIFINGEPLE